MQDLQAAFPGLLWGLVALVPGSIVGAAWGPITRSSARVDIAGEIDMDDAVDLAASLTDWRIGERVVRPVVRAIMNAFRSNREPSENVIWFQIGVGILVVCAVVQSYVAHTNFVVFILSLLALIMLVATLTTFWILARRHVVAATSPAWQLFIALAVLFVVSIANAVFLVNPPVESEALLQVRAYLAANPALVSVIFTPSLGMVELQILGAGITLIGLIASISLAAALLTSVHITRGVWGQPLWLFLFWCTRFFTKRWVWWTSFSLCIAATLLTSGLGYAWISSVHPAQTSPLPLSTYAP